MRTILHVNFLTALLVLMLFAQCTRSTDVGSSLIDQDKSILVLEDSFMVLMRSFPVDSFESYRPGSSFQSSGYPLGFVQDPFLGETQTTLYMELAPSYGFSPPRFDGAQFDSLVLSVGVDTNFIIGDISPMVDLDVFRLTEVMPRDTLYSSRSFAFDNTPVGTLSGSIWPVQEQTYVFYGNTTNDTLTSRQLRIRLAESLAMEIMAMDSTTLVDDTLFIDQVPGFALQFRNPVNAFIKTFYNHPNTSLTLYFRDADDMPKQARWMPFDPPSTLYVSHLAQSFDRSTAQYADQLLMNESSDGFHFLQGLSGNEMEIYFPSLPRPEKILVNYASLELSVLPLDNEDPETYGPIPQIELYTYNDQGEKVLIDDVIFALGSSGIDASSLQNLFGGFPRKNAQTGLITYKFNLSAQIQKIWDGSSQPLIFARVRRPAFNPERMIIAGFNSSTPPKLSITYNRL